MRMSTVWKPRQQTMAAAMAPVVQRKILRRIPSLYARASGDPARSRNQAGRVCARHRNPVAAALHLRRRDRPTNTGTTTASRFANEPTTALPRTRKSGSWRNSKTLRPTILASRLPKGQVCAFYRRDTDGQLEFVGENTIDHTPKDETIRVYTGNAFDVVGERKRTNYRRGFKPHWMDESFRNSHPQPQEGSRECSRGRAPVSLDELENDGSVA